MHAQAFLGYLQGAPLAEVRALATASRDRYAAADDKRGLAAVGNLAAFLTSFQITGISDPVIQFQARMRFLAFTGQFVQREYDPLASRPVSD